MALSAGVTAVTVGQLTGPMTVNCGEFASAQPVFSIVIGPVAAPAGTVAVIVTALTTLKVAATPPPSGPPLNFTPVTPSRFVPVIVTVSPTEAPVGVRLSAVG